MANRTRIRPIARRALAAQSDERLVRLLREGHDAAFEEIVGRYQQPLTAFAAAIVPFHRAEDVVQASLLKAHKALLADDREVSLRAWLFTIVRNGALNVIRDDPDWQELDPSYDGVPQPAAVAEQNEELQALVTAICALPESQRRALVGRELEGEGHAEIAAELGTSTTAVRGLIFRARRAVRNAVGAAIPLPMLRLLLIEAPAAGAAGVGLGVGAIGGGTKLAAALSATAVALGGGAVIEQRATGDGGSNRAEAAEQRDGSGGGGAAPVTAPAAIGTAAIGTGPAAPATLRDSSGGPHSAAAKGGGSGGSGGGFGSGTGGSGSNDNGDTPNAAEEAPTGEVGPRPEGGRRPGGGGSGPRPGGNFRPGGEHSGPRPEGGGDGTRPDQDGRGGPRPDGDGRLGPGSRPPTVDEAPASDGSSPDSGGAPRRDRPGDGDAGRDRDAIGDLADQFLAGG